MSNTAWLTEAYGELFKGHLHILKSLNDIDKKRLSLAISRYADDREHGLKHPAKDPARALFGQCNDQGAGMAAARLIVSYGVNPSDIPRPNHKDRVEIAQPLQLMQQASLI